MPIFCKQLPECIGNKRCKNFTFADQVFCYSTKFNKRAKNCSTTTAKTLKVMTG